LAWIYFSVIKVTNIDVRTVPARIIHFTTFF